MFRSIKNYFNKKALKDEKFAFLFDEPQDESIVVFDCETTGLDVKKDEIISIGAIKIKDNKILTSKAFEVYIKPEGELTSNSIKIHQIRNCDLQDALPSKEAIESFLEFIGNSKLVGYYLEFDVAMINKYTKKLLGVTLPNLQEEVSAIYYNKKVKTIPQGNINLSFNAILEDLNLPKIDAHNALNDALMTALIYLKLKNTKKLKERI